jgi:hypothetical protein
MSAALKSNLLRRTAAILSAAATFLIAGQASALQVTMGGAVTAQCGSATMSVTVDGNVSISCSSGSTTSATFTLSAPATLGPNVMTVNEIQVNRSGSMIDAINVPFSATGCTPTTGQVTFGAGISTPQSIAVTTPASGSCGITLGTPSSPGVLGSPNSATIAIVDPNANVSFTFAAAATATQIGAAASMLTVQRSGGSAGTWNVPYTVSGATTAATVGGSTLSFAPGSSSATIAVTPAATAPAGVTLPANLTVTLATPTPGAGAAGGQTGSIGAIPSENVTVGPAPAGGCPAPPAGMLEATLGGPGNVLLQMQSSNQVVSIPLPAPPTGRYTAQITLSESAGGAYTPQPVTRTPRAPSATL